VVRVQAVTKAPVRLASDSVVPAVLDAVVVLVVVVEMRNRCRRRRVFDNASAFARRSPGRLSRRRAPALTPSQ